MFGRVRGCALVVGLEVKAFSPQADYSKNTFLPSAMLMEKGCREVLLQRGCPLSSLNSALRATPSLTGSLLCGLGLLRVRTSI